MDCNNNHLDLAKHLNAMLRVSGALVGLPIVEVSGHTEKAVNCELAHLTFEDLVKKSIGVDSCGKPAIRVKFIDSCTYKTQCANNGVQDNLREMFAYDSTAKTVALVLNKST
jgi:hypothetical protein